MNEPLFNTRRRWILAGLMATMMLAAMDTTIVATAVPQVVGDLGGFALFTWVFSLYLLAQTVTIPIYGKLADMYGRKPVLIIGSLIFLLGSTASAAAWNMPALIVFRGLQGLGAGSIMATVNTLAGDLYTLRERARIQGMLSSVWGFSAIVGPTVGGAFAEYVSWRWIFLVNLPVGAVAITLIWKLLQEEIAVQRHRLDFAGAGGVLGSVGLLIFGLLQGGHAWPWLSWPSLATFVLAALLAAATVAAEKRAAEPIIPGWLWRHRALAGANVAMVCMGIVLMGPNAYLPTFEQTVLGLGAISAGLVLATMSIGWPTASSLSGQFYLRIGFRNTALIGTVLLMSGSAGFLFLPYPGTPWMLIADQVVLGAGFGLVSTSLLVGMQSTVDWHQRGVVTGANMFSRYLGQSLGAALYGAIFNAAIAGQLASAPAALKSRLPSDVDQIIAALHAHYGSEAVKNFLQHAVYTATQHIYLGLLALAVLALAAVISMPHRMPSLIKHGS
jgi:EmrB/QacA subfamily drug resistance transporter